MYVDDLINCPNLWIGNNIRIIVRKIKDSKFCELSARVKIDRNGDITRNGNETVVQLGWIFEMTTGNLCVGPDELRAYIFNGHFRVRHVPFSRALMRAVVMLHILARRAKSRVFRKWISTFLMEELKLGWSPSGNVTSFLWGSINPMGVYVTVREETGRNDIPLEQPSFKYSR